MLIYVHVYKYTQPVPWSHNISSIKLLQPVSHLVFPYRPHNSSNQTWLLTSSFQTASWSYVISF